MGHCCARCMKFGEWKRYRGRGMYKAKFLCTVCKTVVSGSKSDRVKKKTTSPGQARQKYLDEVKCRAS